MLLVVDLVATIFSGGFAIVYLGLWTKRRDLFWWIIGTVVVVLVLGGIGTVVPALRNESEVVRPGIVLISAVVIVVAVVVRSMEFPPGWIFLGGIIGLASSIAYRAIRTLAGTPFLDRWAYEVGTTVDALIFSVAIIVRIRYAIAERSTMERRLTQATHDAMHDELTGLLNRRGLLARADQLRTGTVFAIDLDEFKTINDLYGHAAGDAVLLEVAEKLRTSLREGDLIARVGGDEFVVVAPRTELHDASAVSDRISAAIGTIKPHGVRNPILGFGASIGFVALEDLAFENALRIADTHAYRIKQSHRAAHRSTG
jgi:diguanylate cyclase (GGDEF)-like protein